MLDSVVNREMLGKHTKMKVWSLHFAPIYILVLPPYPTPQGTIQKVMLRTASVLQAIWLAFSWGGEEEEWKYQPDGM